MAGLTAPRATEMKTVALTSTVLNISSTVVNFATSNIEAADRAVISTNTSNMTCVAWATTTPSPTLGHFIAQGNAPFVINGNDNVRKIHVTSATTLASTISITLEKY
jgi:hypothetical protein